MDARVRHRQLPTYDGTKSYQNLLVGVYGIKTIADFGTHFKSADIQIQSLPLNFIRNGAYYRDSGTVRYLEDEGYYWQSSISGSPYFLYLLSNYLNPQSYSYGKGYGFTVRCLVPLVFFFVFGTGNSLPTVVLKAIRTYWLRCMG